MKTKLLLLFTLILTVWQYGSAFEEHTVMRGESLESIAQKYGLSTEKILEANPDATTLFFIGQKLKIPVSVSTNGNAIYTTSALQISSLSPIESRLAMDAKNYFEQKDWGKAVKTYNKLIKEYPKAVYFYNRGLAQMNNNKNRQAANDLRKALAMADCTPSMKMNGPELLTEAEKRHSEWQERQTNMIAGIVLGAATVGLTTWALIESSKIESADNGYMYTNSASSSNLNQSPDMNEVFNQIMAKTIQEGQMQEQAEYNQARTVWYQMTGKDLSIDEWRAQKGQALMNMQSQGIDVDVNTNFHDDYWSDANRKERQHQILNSTAGEKCGLCKGSGKCHACNGTKIASSFGNTYKCTLCNDKGDCPKCNGTGLASWNR